MTKDDKELWKEVRKKGSKFSCVPSIVDDVQGDVNMCTVLMEKYRILCNSVPYNEHDVTELDEKLTRKVNIRCAPCMSQSAGQRSTNQMVHQTCPPIILLMIRVIYLFSTMVSQAYAPREMKLSTLVPIPRHKRMSLNDSLTIDP